MMLFPFWPSLVLLENLFGELKLLLLRDAPPPTMPPPEAFPPPSLLLYGELYILF